MNPESTSPTGNAVRVKIFGLGTAGLAMLDGMPHGDFAGAQFVAVNTDAASLAGCSAPEKILLETKMLRGLGTGGDPERGRELAEAHAAQFKSACAGVEAVFILAGLGGGAGTGIAPVVARAAKEAGALVLGFVTLPFDCEGSRRQHLARAGLEELRAAADGVICLPCQKVIALIDENASLLDTFKITTQFLLDGVRGVWRLLAFKGLIPLHFADLCAVLRDRHTENCFAAVAASGPDRVTAAVERLFAHPMLDAGAALAETRAALVSVVGGRELKLADVNRVMEQIKAKCPNAELMLGAVVDEQFQDQLALTVIATRAAAAPAEKKAPKSRDEALAAGEEGPGFDTELLRQSATRKPASRITPPPPTLSPEQREELVAKHTGKSARSRKAAARSRQMPLPLEIVSKNRFDKTEATIHNGEDLDVPTYLRRGISLN